MHSLWGMAFEALGAARAKPCVGEQEEACVAGAALGEVVGPALKGLVDHGKEFGCCCELHGKPQKLLKLEGDMVSFACYRLYGSR